MLFRFINQVVPAYHAEPGDVLEVWDELGTIYTLEITEPKRISWYAVLEYDDGQRVLMVGHNKLPERTL